MSLEDERAPPDPHAEEGLDNPSREEPRHQSHSRSPHRRRHHERRHRSRSRDRSKGRRRDRSASRDRDPERSRSRSPDRHRRRRRSRSRDRDRGRDRELLSYDDLDASYEQYAAGASVRFRPSGFVGDPYEGIGWSVPEYREGGPEEEGAASAAGASAGPAAAHASGGGAGPPSAAAGPDATSGAAAAGDQPYDPEAHRRWYEAYYGPGSWERALAAAAGGGGGDAGGAASSDLASLADAFYAEVGKGAATAHRPAAAPGDGVDRRASASASAPDSRGSLEKEEGEVMERDAGPAPDPNAPILDEATGFYWYPQLGYYYDTSTGYFCDPASGHWLYYASDTGEYLRVAEVGAGGQQAGGAERKRAVIASKPQIDGIQLLKYTKILEEEEEAKLKKNARSAPSRGGPSGRGTGGPGRASGVGRASTSGGTAAAASKAAPPSHQPPQPSQPPPQSGSARVVPGSNSGPGPGVVGIVRAEKKYS